MKILGLGLVILTTVFCEVPPPYSGSFRPSQPLLLPAYGPPKLQSTPQTQYGVPNTRNVEYLEDLLGPIIPQRTAHNIRLGRPQTNYIRPRIVTSPLQTAYGAPPSKQKLPEAQYGKPNLPQNSYRQPLRPFGQNWQQQIREPQVIYGAPSTSQGFPRSNYNNYQATIKPFANNIGQNQQQVQYGVPVISQNNNYQTPSVVRYPQEQYGVPDQRGIENFERFEQRNQIQQRPLTQQYLPSREAVDFRQSVNFGNKVPAMNLLEQYDLPIKETTNFKNPQLISFGGVQNDIDLPIQNRNADLPANQRPVVNHPHIDVQQVEVKSVGQGGVNPQSYQPAGDNYLPSSTTPRIETDRPSIPTARATTATSTTVRPTEETIRATEATVEESTDISESEFETSGDPNVAIATAVAGGDVQGQTFYLVQPDGRFQRVVYQKTRELGDQENEYTANYNFQNIQVDPNSVYTPLITLG